MPKGKKELINRVTKSVALQEADWKYLREEALKMSLETGSTVTPTELIRRAIYKIYPEIRKRNEKPEKK